MIHGRSYVIRKITNDLSPGTDQRQSMRKKHYNVYKRSTKGQTDTIAQRPVRSISIRYFISSHVRFQGPKQFFAILEQSL